MRFLCFFANTFHRNVILESDQSHSLGICFATRQQPLKGEHADFFGSALSRSSAQLSAQLVESHGLTAQTNCTVSTYKIGVFLYHETTFKFAGTSLILIVEAPQSDKIYSTFFNMFLMWSIPCWKINFLLDIGTWLIANAWGRKVISNPLERIGQFQRSFEASPTNLWASPNSQNKAS